MESQDFSSPEHQHVTLRPHFLSSPPSPTSPFSLPLLFFSSVHWVRGWGHRTVSLALRLFPSSVPNALSIPRDLCFDPSGFVLTRRIPTGTRCTAQLAPLQFTLRSEPLACYDLGPSPGRAGRRVPAQPSPWRTDLVGSCPAPEDDGKTVKKIQPVKGAGRMEPLHPEPEPLGFLGLRLSQTTMALSGVKPQLGYLLLP